MSLSDGPKVQNENNLYSFADTKLGNVTASVGFGDRLRPTAQLEYTKEAETIGANSKTVDTTTVTATTAIGKPASINYSVTSSERTDSDANGNSTMLQKGYSVTNTFGGETKLTAAVRGDYGLNDREKLSGYFTAVATAGSTNGLYGRVEAGVCYQPPNFGDVDVPNACVGGSIDTDGKARAHLTTGFKF